MQYNAPDELKSLIQHAEMGNIDIARKGLREFTVRRPGVLLAWKWLADIAETPKERSEAIRRARFLAPGDTWLVEAEKFKMPPKRPVSKPQTDQLPYNPIVAENYLGHSQPLPVVTGSGIIRSVPLQGDVPGRQSLSFPNVSPFPISNDSTNKQQPIVHSDSVFERMGYIPSSTAPTIAQAAIKANDSQPNAIPSDMFGALAENMTLPVVNKSGQIMPKPTPTLPMPASQLPTVELNAISKNGTQPTPPAPPPSVEDVLRAANLLDDSKTTSPFSALVRPFRHIRDRSKAAVQAMNERTQPLRTTSVKLSTPIVAMLVVCGVLGVSLVLAALLVSGYF